VRLQPLPHGLHGRWPPATGGFCFGHKALAQVFQAKVLDAFERAGLALSKAFAVPCLQCPQCHRRRASARLVQQKDQIAPSRDLILNR
jgi:hypothetical protein